MEHLETKVSGEKKSVVFVSYRTAICACVACGCLILFVGLLCGLLPKNCDDIGNNEPIFATNPATQPNEKTTSPQGSTQQKDDAIWNYYRLPRDLIPSHYDLHVRTDLVNFIFEGSVTITFTCESKTNYILLHSKQLAIDRNTAIVIESNGGNVLKIVDLRFYPVNEYLLVELTDNMMVGREYNLTLSFNGNLTDSLNGYYRSSYTTSQQEKRWLSLTFFAPTYARMAFPCFDEPDMKAAFTISLEHRDSLVAISNMPLSSPVVDYGSGWLVSHFQTSVPMSTYLVCYVVCDFEKKEKNTTNNVLIRVWARPDAIDSVNYALEKGADILDFYDDYFGTKFPLPKMDMIAIPDFAAGAMENWGLITYRETTLLYLPGVSSAYNKQRVCAVVSHELAHQWFGNLVTLKWWDDTWLNEGFASFVEYSGVEHVEPTWQMQDQFLESDIHPVFKVDALETSRPISIEVRTTAEINQMFDTISYNKGSSVIRMCQFFLGEDTFKKGLKNYLSAFAYSNAENNDLWLYLTAAAKEDGKDIDVKTVMETWIDQMGFPSVNVTRSYNGDDTFTATQHHFRIDPVANFTTHYPDLGYVWWVPLTYTTATERQFINPNQLWMDPSVEKEMATIPGIDLDEWILVNINHHNYYRVNYDTKNWEMLSNQLTTNHTVLPQSTRSAIINDAFNLARAGEVSQVTALDLTKYLTNEMDYIPWTTVSDVMGYIDLMLCRSKAYGDFKKYMGKQVTPFYDYVGWDAAGLPHVAQLSQATALSLACGYGNEECKNIAINLYAEWMQNSSNNVIPVNLKYTVYCTAIAAGDQEEWYFAWNQFQTSLVSSERSTLLGALACSQEPWILNTYLNYCLDPDKIKSQDVTSVVSSVAGNTIGSSLAWDFFQANWDFFRKTYGDNVFNLASMVTSVTTHFNTDFELNELEEFMKENPDQGTAANAFSKSVSQTKANIRWMNSYLEEVFDWLQTI
ncbi:aminopeptidase N-like [Antedon mediterranea]|uniref:aminopeptidase N-like n=1 Tax=Antedon mediterranea TaxID=105859 RepID=UPI003AF72CD2